MLSPQAFLFESIILVEALVALELTPFNSSQAELALAFDAARLIGLDVLYYTLRRGAPWLRAASCDIDGKELAELIRRVLAALVPPRVQAVAVEGSIMVIGAIDGPEAIPAFSIVRKLKRTKPQFNFRSNIAAMPVKRRSLR